VPTELNRASEPVVPNLEHIAQLIVHVLEPIEAGRNIRGSRRLIPITGGQVTGPRLFGRVLPGGADHQLIRTDGISEMRLVTLSRPRMGIGSMFATSVCGTGPRKPLTG
jgi:hypothetical protein